MLDGAQGFVSTMYRCLSKQACCETRYCTTVLIARLVLPQTASTFHRHTILKRTGRHGTLLDEAICTYVLAVLARPYYPPWLQSLCVDGDNDDDDDD